MTRIYKLIMVISFISMFYMESRGQYEEYLQGKFFVSPDFGLMVGTTTRIDFSPTLGYYVNDRLCLAGGVIYEYYKQSGSYLYNYETNIYGPKAFARFILINNLGELLPIQSTVQILVHAEYESLSLDNKYFSLNPAMSDGRFWYSTALIGGGFSQSTSERLKLNALILWDVDTSSRSPYINPIFRFGIEFLFNLKK